MPDLSLVDLSALAWAALAVGALTIGISKTAIPGANIAIALFAMVLPAKPSTAAVLLLLIVGDLFALWFYRRHADWTVLRRLVPPVIAGVAVGAVFLAYASNDLVGRVIGAILISVISLGLVQRWRVARRADQVQPHPSAGWAQAAAYGSLGGFTTMVANAAGPVMSMYFLAVRLPVTTFLGTSAWFFFVINVTKVPFALGLGLVSPQLLLIDLILVPFVVVGAFLGRVLIRYLSQRVFEWTVIVASIAGAVYLLVR
ncbi:MAG: sulfite exporter TauE/SafE family protein [Beutenbergiaceae bacterium]